MKRISAAFIVGIVAATTVAPLMSGAPVSAQDTVDGGDLDCGLGAVTPCLRSSSSSSRSQSRTPSNPAASVPRLAGAIYDDCQYISELAVDLLRVDYALAAANSELTDLRQVQPVFADRSQPEIQLVSANPVRSFYTSGASGQSRALCQIIISSDWGVGLQYSNHLVCRVGNRVFTTMLLAAYTDYSEEFLSLSAYERNNLCIRRALALLPNFRTDMELLEMAEPVRWFHRMLLECGLVSFRCWTRQAYWQEQWEARSETETSAAEA